MTISRSIRLMHWSISLLALLATGCATSGGTWLESTLLLDEPLPGVQYLHFPEADRRNEKLLPTRLHIERRALGSR